MSQTHAERIIGKFQVPPSLSNASDDNRFVQHPTFTNQSHFLSHDPSGADKNHFTALTSHKTHFDQTIHEKIYILPYTDIRSFRSYISHHFLQRNASNIMTHRYGLKEGGIPLAKLSANASLQGYQLLVRVTHVNENGKLILPVRELWASNQDADGDIDYLVYNANQVEDDEEDRVTLEEANECLSMFGQPWLRALDAQSPFGVAGTERWFVTKLVRPGILRSIWKWSGSCYIIDEENLRVWLDEQEGIAEQFDDEDDWWCLTHNSSDEDSLESVRKLNNSEEDEDMEEGGVSLLESDEDGAVIALPKLNLSLVECDACNTDVGYEGDDEKESFWGQL